LQIGPKEALISACDSMNELSKHPASMEIYKTIFETWRSQVDSWWQRSNYFAAFELAALAGCWHLVESGHLWTALLGSILGISLTIVWWSSNSAVHNYVDYWWASIRKIEQKVSLQDEGFDFVGQHPGSHGWVRYSRLVQIVPGLFMAAWIVLVGYEFYHACPATRKGPMTELLFLPEWVLVIVGIITAAFIGWQSWETRKAAQATLLNAQALIASERAWLLTERIAMPASFETGAVQKSASAIHNLRNYGRTPAIVLAERSELQYGTMDGLLTNQPPDPTVSDSLRQGCR